MTFTPSFVAFSSFDPAESPARRKSVFLLTDPETFPPLSLIKVAAAVRRERRRSLRVRG